MTSQERLKEIEKELLGYEEVAKKIDELRKEKTKITKTLEKEKYSALPFCMFPSGFMLEIHKSYPLPEGYEETNLPASLQEHRIIIKK